MNLFGSYEDVPEGEDQELSTEAKTKTKVTAASYDINNIREGLLKWIDINYCQLVYAEVKAGAPVTASAGNSKQGWSLSSLWTHSPIEFTAGGFTISLKKMLALLDGESECNILKRHLVALFAFPTVTQFYNYLTDPQSPLNSQSPICANKLSLFIKSWPKLTMQAYIEADRSSIGQHGLKVADINKALKDLTSQSVSTKADLSSGISNAKGRGYGGLGD